MPRRRIEDLPFAAVVLRRVLRATGARRVVFSANGLREGWFMRRMPGAPCAPRTRCWRRATTSAQQYGRDPTLPPALLAWTDPLFPGEGGEPRRLREAACWMSDIGSHDHPEYRAEQAFLRVLRQPGIGLDHHARAFLGLTLALRYEAEPEAPFLATGAHAAGAATPSSARPCSAARCGSPTRSPPARRTCWPAPCCGSNHRLALRLAEGSGVFAGESVTRRLDRLAQALGLQATTELAA